MGGNGKRKPGLEGPEVLSPPPNLSTFFPSPSCDLARTPRTERSPSHSLDSALKARGSGAPTSGHS